MPGSDGHSKRNLDVWDSVAESYASHLNTSIDDVHFGVGIAGNTRLRLIPPATGSAIDLGCGSGENLIALSNLGYVCMGVDSSASQLRRAESLLRVHGTNAELRLIDIQSLDQSPLNRTFDLILSVGVAHFLPDLSRFFSIAAGLAEPGAILVLSVPHPIDMVADFYAAADRQIIEFHDYFPVNNMIENAHYWRRFAGHQLITTEFTEYICRPSEVINYALAAGFRVDALLEPPTEEEGVWVPCTYSGSAEWFQDKYTRRVPQYLILKATYTPPQTWRNE